MQRHFEGGEILRKYGTLCGLNKLPRVYCTAENSPILPPVLIGKNFILEFFSPVLKIA